MKQYKAIICEIMYKIDTYEAIKKPKRTDSVQDSYEEQDF